MNPKYMVSWYQGKRLPLDGGMAVYGAKGGVPMHSKAWLNMTSVGVGEILASGTLAVFFSLTFSLLTQKQHPIMGYTRTKSCIINSGTKR